MLRTWLEPHDISVPESFTHIIGGNPLVSQVLFSRGIREIDSARGFLTPSFYHPAPPSDIPGLEKAADYLDKAISTKKVIGVWGDFDVDGQTSTTVLVSALREMGGKVIYHIPVRAEESHGISLPALEKFIQQGAELVLTCDTGISAYEAITYANNCGVPVIITDHHDLPAELPQAEAIVNPKMLPPGHPLSYLPGVGVAYKVVDELWQRHGQGESAQAYLDLVALGIVADLALQKADTRYLLQLGLERLCHTTRPGLIAIMEMAELEPSNLTEEHIAFVLAPRMNALGRLDDANSMVELFTTSDMGRARILALELEGMNAQRKLLTDQVFQAAQAQVSSNPKLLDYPVLVLSHPTWPAGVIGVVASRLVEQYHRPVILLSAPPGEDARGSARSIEAINITAAIAANQELLKGFGGHPMAAGLSIDPQRIPDFRIAISHTVQEMGLGIQVEKDLQIDGYLTLPELSLELVEDFERLAPFGAGNPPLAFATRNLKLTGYTAVGRSSEHLLLTIEDELGHIQRSIWWQGAGYTLPETNFDLAYSVRASTYRGQRDVQVEWVDYRIVEEQAILLEKKKRPLEVIDLRSESDPPNKLNQLLGQEQVLVWGEAEARLKITCLDRFSLLPTDSLAIWTIPPGLQELQDALQKVKPSRIFLFGVNPGMDEVDAFLMRLAGLVKNQLKSHQGSSSLSMLAVATAQKISTVKVALEWLVANGHIRLESIKGDEIKLAAGATQDKESTRIISSHLQSLLAESAAFRRYYLTADKDQLVYYDSRF